MRPVPEAVRSSDRLVEASRAVALSPEGVLPVVDDHGAYCGTVAARAVAEELADGEHEQDRVAQVVELPPAVTSTDSLNAGIDALERSGGSAVPVLDLAEHYADIAGR